jgi:hypothetical protein
MCKLQLSLSAAAQHQQVQPLPSFSNIKALPDSCQLCKPFGGMSSLVTLVPLTWFVAQQLA